jgi:hypothetical protein
MSLLGSSCGAKKLQATITLEYENMKVAEAVAAAISPDNQTAPEGLTVKTSQNSTQVLTDIVLDCKLATFIATIDDLLESASTAEKTLHVAKKQ